jgi:hypothetical protein
MITETFKMEKNGVTFLLFELSALELNFFLFNSRADNLQ